MSKYQPVNYQSGLSLIPAGIMPRLAAQCIDAAIVLPVVTYFFVMSNLFSSSPKTGIVIGTGIYLAYTLMDLSVGGTAGKRLLGLCTLAQNGGTPKFASRLARWMVKYWAVNVIIAMIAVDAAVQVYRRRTGIGTGPEYAASDAFLGWFVVLSICVGIAEGVRGSLQIVTAEIANWSCRLVFVTRRLHGEHLIFFYQGQVTVVPGTRPDLFQDAEVHNGELQGERSLRPSALIGFRGQPRAVSDVQDLHAPTMNSKKDAIWPNNDLPQVEVKRV